MTIVHRYLYSQCAALEKPNASSKYNSVAVPYLDHVGRGPSEGVAFFMSFRVEPIAYYTSIPATPGSAAPRILACSALDERKFIHDPILKNLYDPPPRPLGSYRKGFFDHLYPGTLVKNTLRVVIMQTAQVGSQYFNDQLRYDLEREQLVSEGRLNDREAQEQCDAWADREWLLRWTHFPHRLMTALAKYHAITLVMRLYEYLASRFVSEETMDKLTIDPSSHARHDLSPYGIKGVELGREMITKCWHSGLILYLADYSVHQVILLFGYYIYVKQKRNSLSFRNSKSASDEGKKKSDSDESKKQSYSKKKKGSSKNSATDELHGGSLALSALKKSTLLVISRVIGLLLSSIGGGLGSMILPGLGTSAGINLGDGLAMFITEEMMNISSPTTFATPNASA